MTSKALVFYFLFIVLVASLAVPAYALTPSDETVMLNEIEANADTIVDETQPDTNFGNARDLVARDFVTVFSFIRFNISSIPQEIKNAQSSSWQDYIKSAKLRFFVYQKPSSGDGLVGTQYFEQGWNEYTLTYDLLEQMTGGQIAGISGDPFSYSQIQTYSLLEINVTRLVNTWVRSHSNSEEITFHINVQVNQNFTFSSRHHPSGFRPTLFLTYKKISTTLTSYLSKENLTLTESIKVWGIITPALKGAIIKLLYRSPEGGNPIERRATLDDAGQFEDNFTPSKIGLWRVTAQFDGDNIYAKTVSNELTFTLKELTPMLSPVGEYLMYLAVGIAIGAIPLGSYFLYKRRKK